MKNLLAALLSFLLVSCGMNEVYAQIIPSIPYTLTNGSLADATQVMGNFNTIVTDTNANAATAGVNTNITSITGLTTPLSNTYGGTVIYTGGITGGSANAQTLSPVTPSLFALTLGNIVTGIAGNTNSGAMTLSVAGGAPQSVVIPTASGLISSPANTLVSSQAFSAIYDGTYWELLDAPPSSITNAQLGLMSANTIKANPTASNAAPSNLALTSNSLLGLSSTGTNLLAPITLDPSLQTRGNILGLASVNGYQASPADPTARASASGVMMGLAGAITPSISGNIFVIITGNIAGNNGAAIVTTRLTYGTGSAPANNASPTGTQIGTAAKINFNGLTSPAGVAPFTTSAFISGLAIGTAYWLDEDVTSSGGFTGVLTSISISAFEVP